MRYFGLIGYPLTSSFSKKYFTEKFARENIDNCQYNNYPLASIDEFLPLVSKNPELNGLNVTIPYKKDVVEYLHESSEPVKIMKACNCITFVNGRRIGYNTDVVGFRRSFFPLLQSHHRKALILGTGGAAAAVEYVLADMGMPYLFVTRNNTNKDNAITYDQVAKELLAEHLVIINTTPLGMSPDTYSAPPIPYELLTERHYLYDLVYNPAETTFLKNGRTQGALTKNGEDMLVIQAEESWKIWNE